MLQQVHTTEQQEDAANVRLTMEELARAVSRYETRKMTDTQVPPDTMTIGEAIEQLSLHATPEELLEEVERERQRAEAKEKLENPPWKSQERRTEELHRTRRQRNTIAALSAFLFASAFMNIIMFGGLLAMSERRNADRAATVREIIPASQGNRTLTGVPDGQTVYANMDTVNQLANGKSQAQTRVFTSRNHDNAVWNSHWGLIKLNDKVYVRGWAAPGTLFVGSRKYNFVSHNPDALDGYTTRTVPIEEFKDILDPSYIDPNSKVRGVFIPE